MLNIQDTFTDNMQAKQIQGLWYLLDSRDNKVYAYEKEPTLPYLYLGEYSSETGKVTLRDDWKEAYEGKLHLYRQTEKPRSRVPTTTGLAPAPAQAIVPV